MLFALLLIILSSIYNTTALINPYGPTIVSEFANCVSQLLEANFIKPGLLIFANTNNVSSSVAKIRAELLRKIHGYAKFSVEVKSPMNVVPICVGDKYEEFSVIHSDVFVPIPLADYFLIVIDSYTDFTYVASRAVRSRSWNPLAKIIILFFRPEDSDKVILQNVEKMLNCLFKQNVINIAVVVPQKAEIRNAYVYSWKPYDPPKYCGYFNESAKNRIIVETTCERGFVKENKNIFENRIPTDMRGCELQMLALERTPFVSADVEDPNIERIFVDEIAARYNLRTAYRIINQNRGERSDEGDWDGALREVAAKKGHIVLGGIFPDYDVHEDFAYSTTYLADSYTWVVPRAFPSPPWVALIVIFQELVWYSAIVGFLVCVCSWKVLGHYNKESAYHTTFKHCFLNAWISQLGFCCYARPVTQSLRVFYVFFNLYCILFLTCYQTKLIDVLKNPTSEEQIDTIEELVNSGLPFGGSEELHDLFFNSSDDFDRFIGDRWLDVENVSKALIDVAVHRNFSMVCSRLELDHWSAIMPELSDSSGTFKFFAFETDVFTVPIEMIALKGFAFIDNFSHTLRNFKQAGIPTVVRNLYAVLNSLKRAKLLRSLLKENSDVNPLSVQHLQGGFLALTLIGFVGGTLVLIIEILIQNYVKRILKIKKK